MKALAGLAVLISMLVGACSSNSAPDLPDEMSDSTSWLEDAPEVVLTAAQEDWCDQLEGRAGGWLVAGETGTVVDPETGEAFTLDPSDRTLLLRVATEGAATLTPDEMEQLDTFFRYPAPPTACQAAYEGRQR